MRQKEIRKKEKKSKNRKLQNRKERKNTQKNFLSRVENFLSFKELFF